MTCDQELCGNWTGDGCACALFGIDPTCGACEAEIHEQCERVRTRSLGCCCNDEEMSA